MSRELSILDYRIPLREDRGEGALRSALSIWNWLLIGATCVGGFTLQAPLAVLTAGDETRRRPGRFLRDMAVFIANLNPLWDFAVEGELPDYVPGKTVVISNHVSNSDAFLISHLPWEMKWLGKSSLFRVPFLGWSMWLAGDVAVTRGARDSIKGAMAQCRKHLERGMPVMIFPEGTRSKTADLLPFKDGAFRLAIDTGADILPLAVAGTRDALPKHSWRFGFAKGRISVGEPISTEGMTLDDMEALKTKAREQIEALYTHLAALTS